MSQFSWENEWRLLNLKEESFLIKHVMDKTPKWVSLVRKKVPASLQNTLEVAFGKAFETVFEKGAIIIEKTYQKEKQEDIYLNNKKVLDEEDFHRKYVKKFDRQATKTKVKNLAITSVEGVGFGLAGMGIPDIPIFVSVMLKSIYEIAISYGFSYTSPKEKLFILKMIDTSLQNGDVLRKKDEEINCLIERYQQGELKQDKEDDMEFFVTELQIKRQIDHSSLALSKELLYGKFVQGATIVGVVGGVADYTCLKKITDYATLKYKRRFLLRYEGEDL